MIYFISDGNGFIKIGVADNVEERLKELQTGNAHRLKILKTFKRVGYSYRKYDDYNLEKLLHIYFKNLNADKELLRSEWFEEGPVLNLIEKSDNELNEWFKAQLNFTVADYETYNNVLRKRNTNAEVGLLIKKLKKRDADIRNLKTQISALKKQNKEQEKQIELLSRNLFRRKENDKVGNN